MICIQLMLGFNPQLIRMLTGQDYAKSPPMKKSSILDLTDLTFKKCALQCFHNYTISNRKPSALKCEPPPAKKCVPPPPKKCEPPPSKKCEPPPPPKNCEKPPENVTTTTETPHVICKMPFDEEELKLCGIVAVCIEKVCKGGWVLQCYPDRKSTPYCVCDPCTQTNGCGDVCNYIYRKRYDYPLYGDIDKKTAKDPFSCFEFCRKIPTCQGFVYDTVNQTCWAKNISEITAPPGTFYFKDDVEFYSLTCPRP